MASSVREKTGGSVSALPLKKCPECKSDLELCQMDLEEALNICSNASVSFSVRILTFSVFLDG